MLDEIFNEIKELQRYKEKTWGKELSFRCGYSQGDKRVLQGNVEEVLYV